MKKKILIIGDSIYPDNMGGSHRHIYDLCVRLVKQGNDVIVITPSKNNILKDFEIIDGIKLYRYKRDGNSKIKGFIDFIIQPYILYKKIKKEYKNFDVIHGHWTLTNFLIFFKERKNNKLKKVYTLHGPTFEEYSYEIKFNNKLQKKMMLGFIKMMERNILRNSDVIITASKYMKNKVVRLYGFEEKIKIIPVGTDTDKFKPKYSSKDYAKEKIKVDKDTILILSIRRLKKRMGLDNLIRAFKIVLDKNQNLKLKLFIGGKGEYKVELESITKELGIEENVEFIGFIPDEEIIDYYQSADMFVIPSIDLEGFGLVSSEAMAVGTMVIATPVGGNIEVVGGYNMNLLTDGIEAADIAKKICDVIDENHINQSSEKLLRKYICETFSWDIVFNKITKLYQDTGEI